MATKSTAKPAQKKAPARLIISESESGADMLHSTGFRAPDPFVYLESRGRTAILLSDLEFDRGRRQATVDEVVSLSELLASLEKGLGRKPSIAEVTASFLKARGGSRPLVPTDFPMGLARELENEGIKVTPVDGMFRPERQIKTAEEVRLMTRATRITEECSIATALDGRCIETISASSPIRGSLGPEPPPPGRSATVWAKPCMSL